MVLGVAPGMVLGVVPGMVLGVVPGMVLGVAPGMVLYSCCPRDGPKCNTLLSLTLNVSRYLAIILKTWPRSITVKHRCVCVCARARVCV